MIFVIPNDSLRGPRADVMLAFPIALLSFLVSPLLYS
jgi:hypothetical protein